MHAEFIHYVQRRIISRYPTDIESPWYSELLDYKNNFNKPIYHITRSIAWPATSVEKGDVIWLVSQLSSPWGKLPPSIDAFIEVSSIEKILDKNKKILKILYRASDCSKWFPLVDASEMLANLQFCFKNNEKPESWNQEKAIIGQFFQSMKRIHPTKTKIIREWKEVIGNRDFYFLSYRIIDGTKIAFMKVNSLMKENKPVFWDRWSLPRRLAERRELVPKEPLDLFIIENISKAKKVYCIKSPRYGEAKSYSAKERALAIRLNKYVSVTMV